MLNRRYQILLIIFLVLGVFYPTLFAEFTSIDDVMRAEGLMDLDKWSLKQVFFPVTHGGLYYRPLIDLTFYLDKDLWFLDPGFMHLENILLHLANALLVFFIMRCLTPEQEREQSLVPFVAGCIVAVHPLSTEAVNWVSGRCDLMAGTFILLSTLFIFYYKIRRNRWYLFLASLSLLAGLLSKEVALALLPGLFLILAAREDSAEPKLRSGFTPRALLSICGLFLCLFFMTLLFVYFFRSHAYSSSSGKIGLTLKIIANDPVHSLFVCLRAFGFYLKKLYQPFPLNFGIVEVDPLYELLAIPLVIYCAYLLVKRSLNGAIFLTGIFLIAPALPIAFNQIAWTPYAERYIYVSSAFIVMAGMLFVRDCLKARDLPHLSTVVVFLLIAVLVTATSRRNITWMKNLTLFQDTVAKSPNFNLALNQLGIALFNTHNYSQARQQFDSAGAQPTVGYNEWSNINLAAITMAEGNTDQAIKQYENILKITKGGNEKALQALVEIYTTKTLENPDESKRYCKKMLGYHLQLYTVNKKPYNLYRAGYLSVALGDKKRALACFSEAAVKFPEGDVFRTYSKNMVARLEHK